MSTASEDQAALPLDELQIAPEWVRAGGKSFESHTGEDRQSRRGGDRPWGDRPREHKPRDRGPGSGPSRPPGPQDRRGRGPRPEGRRPEGARPGGPRPGGPRPDDRQRAPAAPAPAPVEVAFLPDEKALGVMIEAMKVGTKTYALFDIAKLILNKPERHAVKLARQPGADGTRAPLFLVVDGGVPFLNQDDALRFILNRQGGKVFKEERKPVDPPKGNFTFVNRCGFTGEWLGPPNYHEYQSRLIRHHQQRLRHIPFEEFKARIQTVKDPEAVKAWVESKSSTIEFQCLLDTEPKSFPSHTELVKHLVDTHLAQLVTVAPEIQLSGLASRQIDHRGMLEAVRTAWNAEWKFPLKTATQLSEKLRQEGFHFFKRKGVTYVGHIKPKRFESTEGLSERIKKILAFLRTHPDAKRKKLLEHFVPAAPAPAPQETAPVPASQEAVGVPAAEIVPAAPMAPAAILTEEDAVLADLHWLIQDGYVVDFSDGRLWALDDKPPKAAPAPALGDKPTETASAEQAEQPVAEAPVGQEADAVVVVPVEQSAGVAPLEAPVDTAPPPTPPVSQDTPA